jgi:hypothetical protein
MCNNTFLFWSTEFNYSLYIVVRVRKDSRCPFERQIPFCALLRCFRVRSLYSPPPPHARTSCVQNKHQDHCDVSRQNLALRSSDFSQYTCFKYGFLDWSIVHLLSLGDSREKSGLTFDLFLSDYLARSVI